MISSKGATGGGAGVGGGTHQQLMFMSQQSQTSIIDKIKDRGAKLFGYIFGNGNEGRIGRQHVEDGIDLNSTINFQEEGNSLFNLFNNH